MRRAAHEYLASAVDHPAGGEHRLSDGGSAGGEWEVWEMNTPVSDAVQAYALAQLKASYVMGATAERCTPKYRRSLAQGRSADYADKIIANCPVLSGAQSDCSGCKHDGQLAFDCAQLSKFAAAAGDISLPSGSNSQWTKVRWAVAGEIAAMPMDVVCFVFHHNDKKNRKTHVGVYLGDGTVVDARGHEADVRHDDVAAYPWTHFAIPCEIAEEVNLMIERPTYAEMRRDTIRKGSTGNAVAELQGLLNQWLPTLQLKPDGLFGTATQAAVIRFQAAHGLKEDGIVGPNTWCVLLQLAADPGEDDSLDPEEESPDIAAMMACVDRAMADLRAAVDALCKAQGGGGNV